MKIKQRHVLVTGANRGLGEVFVKELVARDCKVYACARNPSDLNKLTTQFDGQVIPLKLDVTNQADIAAASTIANDVDLLVNNAGRLDQVSLGEAGDLSSLRGEMEVNVFGLAGMCLAFAPIIGRNGGGQIVNVLSVACISFTAMQSRSETATTIRSCLLLGAAADAISYSWVFLLVTLTRP